MTNYEKFKTAKERAGAFFRYADENEIPNTGLVLWAFRWLDLEAEEEKPLPCPFCGEYMIPLGFKSDILDHNHYLTCSNEKCKYSSSHHNSLEEAIAAHNRVARSAKEKEEK